MCRTDEAFTAELNEIKEPNDIFSNYPNAAFTSEEFIEKRELYRQELKKVVMAFTGENEFKLAGSGLSAD